MTKLRNIDAIKKMLDGTHRTQTKTSVSLNTTDAPVRREVGERWVDETGKEWEQRQGYKISVTKALDVLAETRMPEHCPKCSNPMTKKNLDEKFWRIHKMCFDCVIDMEHQLRIEGKYDEYERQKIRENAMSWLRDAEKDVEDLVSAYRYASFVNQDGSVEKWMGGLSPEDFEAKVRGEFSKFKTEFIDKLDGKKVDETVKDI